MSVIDFIPHHLRRLTVTDGYEDENGDWHEGQEEWGEMIPCHAVASGRANEKTFPDGKVSTYSYTIGRLDPDISEFTIGERIILDISGSEREYTVKGFHRYQLQSKIWV